MKALPGSVDDFLHRKCFPYDTFKVPKIEVEISKYLVFYQKCMKNDFSVNNFLLSILGAFCPVGCLICIIFA